MVAYEVHTLMIRVRLPAEQPGGDQIRSGLIHGFTLSTTTHSNNQIIHANIGGKLRPVRFRATRRLHLWLKVSYEGIGYEVCGYAAKDHSNLNEGEGKEICHLSGIGLTHPPFTRKIRGSIPLGGTIGVWQNSP